MLSWTIYRHYEDKNLNCSNRILRYSFDGAGNPVFKGAVGANGVVDLAFSPDGMEMFATNHRSGGLTRYYYEVDTDT